MKYRVFCFVLILSFSLANAQHRSLTMANEAILLQLSDEEKLWLNLHAASSNIELELAQAGIPFRKFSNKNYAAHVGKTDIEKLNELESLLWIEPLADKAFLLNDSMLSNNRVSPVHGGLAPLKRSYKGKGVIIGFIDTGIDFTHADFQDSLGNTRVLKIWDQSADTLVSSRIPQWNYGQVWDSSDINAGNCPHDDHVLSHGTNVAGIASGNGLALNKLSGVAPESDIIVVANDFSAQNWLQTVADAVEFIFQEADQHNKPCVINISAGTYLGSHDATDIAAQRIDSMILAKRGRSVVAAAGNAGNVKFHLGYDVTSDTTFTWFRRNSNTSAGVAGVYFQLWSDTADLNNVQYSIGAHLSAGSFSRRGRLPFFDISRCLNTLVSDTLFSNAGQRIAIVQSYAQQMGDKYFLEVLLPNPDSANYHYAFYTTGNGKFDVWSDSWLGMSHMVEGPLPSFSVLPEIVNYKAPDSLKTIVSSFTCSPHVITVANYVNRDRYYDFNSALQVFPVTAGERAAASSIGPARRGNQKPDLIASGDFTLTPNRLASIPLHIANNQADRIAQGGMHKRNGGTSMAAPVVAGIAALMMEECEQLSAAEIKQKIIQNVYTDSLTGNVPSNTHGHGKPDAFASLTSLYFVAEIAGADTVPICSGESTSIEGPAAMKNYSWSTGDSTRSIMVDSAGWFILQSTDSASCRSDADSVYVLVHPNPDKPTISVVNTSTLKSSQAAFYQWFSNGQLMAGETQQTLLISSNAYYSVEVSDSNDCSHLSDSLLSYLSILENGANSTVEMHPNPSFDGNVSIAFAKEGQRRIEVLNTNGQMVKEIRTSQSMVRLNGLPNGQFFVRIIEEGGGSYSAKLVVIRQPQPGY